MGAWGIETFRNDDALDWMGDFLEAPTLAFLKETLNSALEQDYIEEPYGSSALAAAEVIAAVIGKTHGPLPEELIEAVARFKPKAIKEDVIALARKAVLQILEDSESKELWEESSADDDYAQWQSNLQELSNKLV